MDATPPLFQQPGALCGILSIDERFRSAAALAERWVAATKEPAQPSLALAAIEEYVATLAAARYPSGNPLFGVFAYLALALAAMRDQGRCEDTDPGALFVTLARDAIAEILAPRVPPP